LSHFQKYGFLSISLISTDNIDIMGWIFSYLLVVVGRVSVLFTTLSSQTKEIKKEISSNLLKNS
jgi:hypothetical protein